MLQKIFKKRSFRNQNKSLVDVKSGSNHVVSRSESFDSSITDTGSLKSRPTDTGSLKSRPTDTGSLKSKPNGYPSTSTLAKKENEEVGSDTGSSKKVSFVNHESSDFKEKPSSPNTEKREINSDLFDDHILKAFQMGDISIADFLQSSPLQSVHTDHRHKTRSYSESSAPFADSRHRTAQSAPKRQTLLDRAHSMKTKTKPKETIDPIIKYVNEGQDDEIRKPQSDLNRVNETKMLEAFCDDSDRSFLQTAIMEHQKHQFSTSLETLAHEIFGKECQKYLSCASKSSAPQSPAMQHADDETAKGVDVERKASETYHMDASPSANERRLISPYSLCSLKVRNYTAVKQRKFSNSRSLNLPDNEGGGNMLSRTIKSWHSASDLSENSSFYFASVLKDESNSIELNNFNSKEMTYHPSHHKQNCNFCHNFKSLSTSDSQCVNVNDGKPKLAENQISLPQFLSSPLVGGKQDIEEFGTGPFVDRFFDIISQNTCVLDSEKNVPDPLIDSLRSLIPLSNDRETFWPMLSKAISDIFSEIISSRIKVRRMRKAIELHQKVLKEQNCEIQKQNLEIAKLGKAVNALIDMKMSSPSSREVATEIDKMDTRSMEIVEKLTTKDYSEANPCEALVQSEPYWDKSDVLQSELRVNSTLDHLLYQCSELQKVLKADNTNISHDSHIENPNFPF